MTSIPHTCPRVLSKEQDSTPRVAAAQGAGIIDGEVQTEEQL